MVDFSIIIPHKDIPDLLQRCLDSIPVRDDVQVIVVDDNSDGNIVDFDHFPQWKGKYYECYFTKEGKGAGYARNVGLEHAKGKWVVFADADDFFYPPALIKLLGISIPEDANIVLYQYRFCREDGSFYIFPEMTSSDESTGTPLVICYDTNVLCRTAVMPWAKMVRKVHLDKNNIRFDEIKWGNDMMYSTKLSLSVDSFLIVPILVYSHEWYPNSLVNKELGLEMFYKRSLLSLKRASLLQRGGKLDYNVFTDQWFRRVYTRSFFYSLFLIIKSSLRLGLKYCIKNWRLFTQKPFFLTRLLIKRLIRKS